MGRRTHYRNGDEISLGGCNGCNPVMINGVFCHEAGCPDEWRDYARACRVCGFDFYPHERFQNICESCLAGSDDDDFDCGYGAACDL